MKMTLNSIRAFTSAAIIIAALFISGCATTSTNPVISTITDPTTVQDVARTATILYVQQNPAARADIAAADAAITVLLQNGTLDPVAVQTALCRRRPREQHGPLRFDGDNHRGSYQKYAGQSTVAGAINQNAQLSAAVSAILAGTTQGLKLTQ